MWYYYVIGAMLLLLVLGVIISLQENRKCYQKGKKDGADEFFKLLLISGYEKKVSDFRVFNSMAKPGGIVFVGDSITQDYNVYEYFSNRQVYNRGIGGDTTLGLLRRLDESVFSLKPRAVVLLIGTNDFGLIADVTPEDIANRIKTICDLINKKMPECPIILESIYPVHERPEAQVDMLAVGSRKNSLIDAANDLLKQIKGVHYLDVNHLLKDQDGQYKLEYTVEGLHCSAQGYKIVSNAIENKLKELKL